MNTDNNVRLLAKIGVLAALLFAGVCILGLFEFVDTKITPVTLKAGLSMAVYLLAVSIYRLRK